jgi:threonine/homoserine/homoserine lactone efflux protein
MDNEQRAKAAGVSGFLRKPLSPQMIEDSAHDAIRAQPLFTSPEAVAGEVAAPVASTPPTAGRGFAKSLGLLVAAPFIGLAYALLLPLVGLATLAWLGMQALAANLSVRKVATHLKNVVLFLAAPFIGLAYALALPLVGVGMLVWVGWQAFAANPKHSKAVHTVKQTGSLLAAPFIGLAFAVLLPLVGLAMLAWMGLRAVTLPAQVR